MSDSSILLIAVPVAAITWMIVAGAQRRRFRQRVRSRVTELVRVHKSALTVRRRQLIVVDAYGNQLTGKWQKEANQFWARSILPRLDLRAQRVFEEVSPENIPHLVEAFMQDVGVDLHGAESSYLSGDPLDYERFCSDLLRSIGWDARTTPHTDQGADVIAIRNGIKLVLQCKLYKTPIGNKAVQEAAGARAHEAADYAAVVTNSRFTPQAQALAKTNRVALLHHDELKDYAAKLVRGRDEQSFDSSPSARFDEARRG